MKEDYLWDRSGRPDPQIEGLERSLMPLRLRVAPLGLPEQQKPRAWLRAAAAALLLAALAAWQFGGPGAPATGWRIAGAESSPVRAGELVRTGGTGITLEAESLGRIDLGPESELRAASTRAVWLRRGVLHAFIWAPPRQFVVDTPSARTVDLGCEYTLSVDGRGDGLVKVSLGWVAFQFRGQESFIPAGAECVTRKNGGPGIPYYEDAPESLRAAIRRYETGDGAAVGAILDTARPRDGLTLWHLLTRVPAAERARVFDRFAGMVELPQDVSREAVTRGDAHAIDQCWDALRLENTAWWRGWERRW